MGDFSSKIGKASNPNENTGQHGEVTENTNGAEMHAVQFSSLLENIQQRTIKKGKCRSEDYRRMGTIGQDHSKLSNRQKVDGMQQSSKLVG